MILLDTHVILWLAREPEVLSAASFTAIKQARETDGLAISDKSLWEIAMLATKGRIEMYSPLGSFLEAVEKRFVVLPINAAIAQRSMSFSARFPSDPSDRIIAATAASHGMPLVTKDELIRRSGEVDCIW